MTVEHEGVEYSGIIGLIEYTHLGFESHGILSADIGFKWDGGGVSVGGFCLDQPKDREAKDYSRSGTAYGLDHIIRIIETIGVERWEQIQGKRAIVLFEGEGGWGSQSVGLAGLDNGKVFIPKLHAEEWRTATTDDEAYRGDILALLEEAAQKISASTVIGTDISTQDILGGRADLSTAISMLLAVRS